MNRAIGYGSVPARSIWGSCNWFCAPDGSSSTYNVWITIESMAAAGGPAPAIFFPDQTGLTQLTRIFRRTGMIFHCVLVGGTAAVVATPPAEGMMLVAPLHSVSSAHTLGWVLPTGARPVAAGPYEGSFVVYGTRSALIATALAHGTLLLNSRLSECGSPTRTIA